MAGAAAAMLLIVGQGLDEWALAAVLVTCVLTTISVMLFGSRKPAGR